MSFKLRPLRILSQWPPLLAAPRPATGTGRVGTCHNADQPTLAAWFGAFPDLRYLKYQVAALGHGSTMATRLFLCPHTGQRVQGWFADDGSDWFADDGSENSGDTYEGVNCLACRQVHMVNPKTGKVLGGR